MASNFNANSTSLTASCTYYRKELSQKLGDFVPLIVAGNFLMFPCHQLMNEP
jgi:hypothetical protein